MGVRVKYTKAEVFSAFFTVIKQLPDFAHINECEIEHRESRDGKWKTESASLRHDDFFLYFSARRHFDGRIRDARRDFEGSREAFMKWASALGIPEFDNKTHLCERSPRAAADWLFQNASDDWWINHGELHSAQERDAVLCLVFIDSEAAA